MLWWTRNPATCQLIIAGLALAIGILVYIIDRDPGHTYFMPEQLSLYSKQPPVFGWVGRHLPDFVHVYAFILLGCAALQPGIGGVLVITLFCLLAEIGFEIGQHPSVAPWVVEHIPDWFSHIPLLENTSAYFSEGRFDPHDVLAFVLGAACAYLTVILMPRYRSASTQRG